MYRLIWEKSKSGYGTYKKGLEAFESRYGDMSAAQPPMPAPNTSVINPTTIHKSMTAGMDASIHFRIIMTIRPKGISTSVSVTRCSSIVSSFLILAAYKPAYSFHSKSAEHVSPKRGVAFFTAETTALSITLAESKPKTLTSASMSPVAMVKMVSPSNMEWAGRMLLA